MKYNLVSFGGKERKENITVIEHSKEIEMLKVMETEDIFGHIQMESITCVCNERKMGEHSSKILC